MFLRVLLLCLLHTVLCSGQSLIGSSQPIVATVGEDVILPCVFNPPRDVAGFTLEWTRPDLDPRFVYVWRSHDELTVVKNPRFIDRTSLFTEELKNGNISLKLTKVKTSDSGTYRCFLPEQGIETSVNLTAGSSSPPVVSVSSVDVWRSAVVLQCDSGAWYPEPELLWLDSEGRLLSAERTHTHTRPDGLYNVSSRVTVEQSSTFTCRVSQSSTNITTQTSFQVPENVFTGNFRLIMIIVIVVVALFFGIIVVGIVVFIRWKRKYSKYQTTKNSVDEAETAVDVEDVHKETGDEPPKAQDQGINTENHLADVQRVTEKKEPLKTELELRKEPQEKKCSNEIIAKNSNLIIDNVDQKGTSVRLRNTHKQQTQQMRGCTVKIELVNGESYIYQFRNNFFLRAQHTLTIWAEGCCPTSDSPDPLNTDLEWKNQAPWNKGQRVTVSIYNHKKQLMDSGVWSAFLPSHQEVNTSEHPREST